MCMEQNKKMEETSVSQFTFLFVFLVLITSAITEDCICEQCEADKVIGLENFNGPVEDSDGDGNQTICARDRDYDDRSFLSICHMLCYNHCTRFRLQTIQENNEDVKIFAIFRTNYYKLHDGECEE